MSLDDDGRTPSLLNLISALNDTNLRNSFREKFAIWHSSLVEIETDPEIVEVLKRMDLREEGERRAQFDELFIQVANEWAAFSANSFLNGFSTIRNKVSAHTEIQYVVDKYQFVDISSLGIKWSDMRKAIELMQPLIELLGLLIRNAGFAWDMLDEQLSKASTDFWLQSEQPLPISLLTHQAMP